MLYCMRYLVVVAMLAVGCVEANDPTTPTVDTRGEAAQTVPDGGPKADGAKPLPDASSWDFCVNEGPVGDVTVAPCAPAFSQDPGAFVQCYSQVRGYLTACKWSVIGIGTRSDVNCYLTCP